MFRCIALRLSVIAAGCGLVLGSIALHAQDTSKRGRKYKPPPPTSRIEVTILRDFNGKPIENAAVVFHPMEGEKDKGNMELKTNEDGKTVIDVLPIGDTVRLQVIAKGFQTYGGDYKIDQPELAVEIRLKRPGAQYSIYKAHKPGADPNAGEGKLTEDGSSADKPSESSGSGAATDKDSKDKPAESAPQQPSQPNQTQPQPN
jgi:hypothetical protein